MRTAIIPKMLLIVVCLFCLAVSSERLSAASDDERLAWWREARFGMFIHYGPVTLTGKELSWSRANSNPKCPNKGETPVEVYDNLYKQFNPTKFDANQWVEVAKKAGMKYIVLTAKHCDGFLLWNSKVDGYNISATPFQRDICAELAQAVHQKGIRLGWYFSPMDWRDQDCRNEHNSDFVIRMQNELRELLTNYGRIDLLWFDTDGRSAPWDQPTTYKIVKTLQPDIIINNRLDMNSQADYNRQQVFPPADYFTPEQKVGTYNDKTPWETCMTLGTQWSWKPDDKIKSISEVVRILVRCVGGDGNLLLNVGPMPDGQIEPRQVEVLNGVGDWLAKNGESIYGTRSGPFKPTPSYGASTRKGNKIFIHLFNLSDNPVKLPAIPAKILNSTVLTGGTAKVIQNDDGIEISVPSAERAKIDTIVVLTLDKPAMSITLLP